MHVVFSPSGGVGKTSIVATALHFEKSAIGIDLDPLSRHLSYYAVPLIGYREAGLSVSGEMDDFAFSAMEAIIDKISSENVSNVYIDLGSCVTFQFLDIIRDDMTLKAIGSDKIRVILHPVITPLRPSSVTSESLLPMLSKFSKIESDAIDMSLWLNEYHDSFASIEKVKSYMKENIPGINKIIALSGFSKREKMIVEQHCFRDKGGIAAGKEAAGNAITRGIISSYEEKMRKAFIEGKLISSMDEEGVKHD